MIAVKERIIGAVTVMNERDAEAFWDIILEKFTPSWSNIEEVEPDEMDSQMLDAIAKDSECHEFVKESDIDWESN